MSKQPSWTEHEAVLLLNGYLQYRDQNSKRYEVEKQLSKDLRMMAINNGRAIDDVFRNVSGIHFQLSSMESAYCGKTMVKPASHLFKNIVALYLLNKAKYDMLLKEAFDMVGGNVPTKARFQNWLIDKVGKNDTDKYLGLLQIIEEFCVENNFLQCKLYNIKHSAEIHRLISKLSLNSEFGRIVGDNGYLYFLALRAYTNFLDSFYPENKIENKVSSARCQTNNGIISDSGAHSITHKKNADSMGKKKCIPSLSNVVPDVGHPVGQIEQDILASKALGSMVGSENGEIKQTISSMDHGSKEIREYQPVLDHFQIWLQKKIGKQQAKAHLQRILEIKRYCIKNGFLSLGQENIKDAKEMKVLQEKLEQDSHFLEFIEQYRCLYFLTLRYYVQYLEECGPKSDGNCATPELKQNTGLTKELDISNSGSDLIIFEGNTGNIGSSEPSGFSLYSTNYPVVSWQELYLKFCAVLFVHNPSVFTRLMGRSILGDGQIDIGQSCHYIKMHRPKIFANGMYLETALEQDDILKRIQVLLNTNNSNAEKIVITLVKADRKKPQAKPASKVLTKQEEVKKVNNLVSERRIKDEGQKKPLPSERRIKDEGQKKPLPFEKKIEGENEKRPLPSDIKAKRRYFIGWLQKNGGSPISAIEILDVLHSVGVTAIKHGILDEEIIYINDIEQLSNADIQIGLKASSIGISKYGYRQFHIALQKYITFLKEMGWKNEKTLCNHDEDVYQRGSVGADLCTDAGNTDKTIDDASAVKMQNCADILRENFPRGFRLTSNIDIKKFIRSYNERYHAENDIGDDNLRESFRENIRKVGIVHEDYVFSVDNVIPPKIKVELQKYIEVSFERGIHALYYRAIFSQFSDAFLEGKIYNEEMLRTYLMHIYDGKYIFEKAYFSKEKDVQIDPKEEIVQFLITDGAPVKIQRIQTKLAHLPKERIEWILHSNQEFISNTTGEYFHVSLIDFSEHELECISKVIETEISQNHFTSGKEMMETIRKRYPDMLARFPQFSDIGLRGAIAYYLNSRFSFTGNIISAFGHQLSTPEVFAEFARTHENFTMDELVSLKTEMNSVIFFDVIYENALRISQTQFVSKNQAQFDVHETDAAIAAFCTGDYIALKDIPVFGTFPYAGFPWNIFLLEHYVSEYSRDFKLLHARFIGENAVGAIVRKSSRYKDYNDILVDVLAKSGQRFTKSDALQYLVDQGYLARRKLSEIEHLLIKAAAKKGK